MSIKIELPSMADFIELRKRVESLTSDVDRLLRAQREPPAEARMTPKEVATMGRVRTVKVYDAIHAGLLPSERRQGRGKLGFIVKRSDAETWVRGLQQRPPA